MLRVAFLQVLLLVLCSTVLSETKPSSPGASSSKVPKPSQNSSFGGKKAQKLHTKSKLVPAKETIASTVKKSVKRGQSSKTKRRQKKSSSQQTTSSHRNQKYDKTFLLRIQSEWKNIVKSGMAFDWSKNRPIRYKGTPQHVWLGPDGSWRHWRFSFTGPADPYSDGLYHGRITLPACYPAKPPAVEICTTSGRFQPETKICLSASHYHPESWQPAAWGVLTLVQSLRLHMTTTPTEIGGCSGTYAERRIYARQSRLYQHGADHADMIQSGWVDGLSWDERDEELVTKKRNAVSGTRLLLSSLVPHLKGPLATWIVVFFVLFIILNRS